MSLLLALSGLREYIFRRVERLCEPNRGDRKFGGAGRRQDLQLAGEMLVLGRDPSVTNNGHIAQLSPSCAMRTQKPSSRCSRFTLVRFITRQDRALVRTRLPSVLPTWTVRLVAPLHLPSGIRHDQVHHVLGTDLGMGRTWKSRPCGANGGPFLGSLSLTQLGPTRAICWLAPVRARLAMPINVFKGGSIQMGNYPCLVPLMIIETLEV
jgi:hypothetical protein